MSDRGVGRGRGRGRGRGSDVEQRRPGEPPQQASRPSGPRPQPPSAWGAPTAAPPRPGMPPSQHSVGRATGAAAPEHVGDVNIQQRMQALEIGKF